MFVDTMLNLMKAILYLAFFYYFADAWTLIIASALGLLALFLTRYSKKLQAEQREQQKEPFVTYNDTCADDNTDYGPEGSVIWGPRTIEENIYINGKWYINENSEEWEEHEE